MNHSKEFIYRFEFPVLNSITFIPAVGHLKPQFNKEVICTFLTETPLIVNKQKLELILYKIKYTDPQKAMLAWDQRQNLIVWKSNEEESKRSSL